LRCDGRCGTDLASSGVLSNSSAQQIWAWRAHPRQVHCPGDRLCIHTAVFSWGFKFDPFFTHICTHVCLPTPSNACRRGAHCPVLTTPLLPTVQRQPPPRVHRAWNAAQGHRHGAPSAAPGGSHARLPGGARPSWKVERSSTSAPISHTSRQAGEHHATSPPVSSYSDSCGEPSCGTTQSHWPLAAPSAGPYKTRRSSTPTPTGVDLPCTPLAIVTRVQLLGTCPRCAPSYPSTSPPTNA